MKLWKLVCLCLLVALVSHAVAAEKEPAIRPHAIDALVAEALEKNPELKFYEAEIAAARAGAKNAGKLASP
ncbi:MAG: TolC family protein, partial [Verrucomicrobiota bacterium]